MTSKEAFSLLGLAEGAKPEDIKRAYRRLAFDLHPDLHPDNPDASREFQRLNEAYVFLSTLRGAGSAAEAVRRRAAGTGAAGRAESTEQARAAARKAYERAKGRFDAGQENTAAGAQQAGQRPEGERRGMDRDEVLRDLLRDPFARRVFEDIYAQLRTDARQARKSTSRAGHPAGGAGGGPAEPGLMGSMVEGAQAWLRRQIDEEQTVQFAGALVPGSRIRLQISHGFLSKPQTIELALPPEFEPGRPIRLKGLGRRLGKWRGDLYLKITAK